MRLFAIGFVSTLYFAAALARGAAPQIPELQWEPRSDWINVKSDVTPAAVGDGKADDTAALQKALDTLAVEMEQRCTVFLPPGVYRITKTLVLRHRDGIMLTGSGRSTRIVWDGPEGAADDSRMFWSDGAPHSVYTGIVWDGNHKAHTGFDHDSHNFFETEIDHRDEAFINFTGSGIRCGHDQARPQAQASAETSILNCLFSNCDRGVELLEFNDYNFTMAGCEFLDCIEGVHGGKGCNFYVRDSHFERSRSTDVFLHAEHSCSIRRCTSIGSREFVDHNCIAPLTVEDCQVSAWTNSNGALFVNGGPAIVFDCVFTKAPTAHPPVVCVPTQRIILSGNQSHDTGGKVIVDGATGAVEVPPGHFGPSLQSPDQRFLDETPEKSGKVFDARRDFGAKGDGKTDDTKAVQATIDAARQQGQDAVAYLPSGDYLIGETIHVTGSKFSLAGCGIHSRLLWKGVPGGIMVGVRDTHEVSICDLDVGEAGHQENGVDIQQIGGNNSSIYYRHIWMFGMYSMKPFVKGFECRGLTSGDVILRRPLHRQPAFCRFLARDGSVQHFVRRSDHGRRKFRARQRRHTRIHDTPFDGQYSRPLRA